MSAPPAAGPGLYTRATPYSYACNACKRCCYGKRIHVSPYEVARIAAGLGISTTEVLARHTEDGGSALAVEQNGACVFLTERGCSVHADRPLACRLYPLGRIVQDDGVETFFELVPHPASEGVRGVGGTVADFLASQDVEPYLDAARGYRDVLGAWVAAIVADGGDTAELLGEAAPDATTTELLDLDRAVAAECVRRGEPEPAELTARLQIHLDLLTRLHQSPPVDA